MREAKFHNFQVVENEPGHFLGGVVLVLLVAPIIYGLAGHPSSEVRAGAYALLLGSVFLCSYFFSHKSFLFRWFIWFCEQASFPESRKMAFFYAALLYVMGTMSILHGVEA